MYFFQKNNISIITVLLMIIFMLPVYSQSENNKPVLKENAYTSYTIDLTILKWYAKKGYNINYSYGFDSTEEDVLVISSFPVFLNELFNTEPDGKVKHYTLQTEFIMNKEFLESTSPPELYFPAIGENWEIFVNGNLLRSDIFIKDDEIYLYRIVRGLIVPIDRSYINAYSNKLVIHFAGNAPTNNFFKKSDLGFPLRYDYSIFDMISLKWYTNEFIEICINGIFLLFAFFFIYLFKIRREKYFLCIGLFSLAFALRFTTRSFFIHDLIWYSDMVYKTEYSLTVILLPLLLLFFHNIIYYGKKVPIILKIIFLINLIFSIVMIMTPYKYTPSLMPVFYSLLLLTGIYSIYMLTSSKFKKEMNFAYNISRYYKYYLIIIFAAMWDFSDAVFFNTGIKLMEIGLLIMFLVTAAGFIKEFFKKHDEVMNLNTELALQKDSFYRFVPKSFLSILNRESILDVKLGDNSLQEMSVLFTDIRSFTSMSEIMTPEENFLFLNSYMQKMEPSIRKHGGFVDKFIGDAIMALFSNSYDVNSHNGSNQIEKHSAEMALNAAIDMRKILAEYNSKRINKNLNPIDFGIGINTGKLILGTVGSSDRIDTTVIGDTVNIASRLESLTAEYKTSIIISDYTYRKIINPDQYFIREIDTVIVKGKTEPIIIYEVYYLDNETVLDLKKKTEGFLKLGIIHYKMKSFVEAKKVFKEALAIYPEDSILQLYLERCEKYIMSPPPENWIGAIKLVNYK